MIWTPAKLIADAQRAAIVSSKRHASSSCALRDLWPAPHLPCGGCRSGFEQSHPIRCSRFDRFRGHATHHGAAEDLRPCRTWRNGDSASLPGRSKHLPEDATAVPVDGVCRKTAVSHAPRLQEPRDRVPTAPQLVPASRSLPGRTVGWLTAQPNYGSSVVVS